MFKKKTEKRSPLKDKPLRLPGQSVQDEMDLILEEVLAYIITGAVVVAMTAAIWISTISKTLLNPWIVTALCTVVICYCSARGYRALKKVPSLKLGRDGERIVAEQLDMLKADGAVVLHDIVAGSFNIDHVILARRGIFVAETKTRSKPSSGVSKVIYDGTTLLVDGVKPDRDPIAQAEMNAQWLSKTLAESTGKRFAVKPVVLFPGWWVENKAKTPKVWVLEPKQLPGFVQHEPVSISDSDLHMAVYHLVQIARTSSKYQTIAN